MYTHIVYSKEEPLWLYDHSPSFEIKNGRGVAMAKQMNDLRKLLGSPPSLDEIVSLYETHCFVYDEDFEMFEFTVTMHGCRFKRITQKLL